jgi:hypothetical protein
MNKKLENFDRKKLVYIMFDGISLNYVENGLHKSPKYSIQISPKSGTPNNVICMLNV